MTTSTDRTTGERLHWPPLAAICLSYFMVILDVTAVTVAVPSIGADLGAGVTALQWVVDGYTLSFAGLLLFSGGLGDRLGARRVFLAGLVVFTVASAACGAAPTAAVLVAARLVQGVGATALVPNSLSLLRTAYLERAARARAFGVWGMVGGIGAAFGPILSGLLVTAFGWRSVFFVNLPVGILGCLLVTRLVPSPDGSGGRGLDVPAQVAAVASLVGLTTALNEAGSLGWTAPLVLGGFALFLLGLAGFLVSERRSAAPILPLVLFHRAEFSASVGVGVLLNLGFYGLLFLAPLYFHQVLGLSALATGMALLPMVGVAIVSSPLAGRVTARTGPRLPMAAGLVVGAVGLAGWLLAGRHSGYLILVAPMIAAGFGTAFTMPASTTAVMEAAPVEFGGAASAVFNTARQVGSALGVALFGSLVSGAFLPGLHAGALIGSAGFLLAAGLTLAAVRTR
jgi:MFS transporter, DHA2 family, methylenomycin A resistance protein